MSQVPPSSSHAALNGAAPIEALLAHREWVRALARTLVRDESSVDDVEQQTWQAALENPPRKSGSIRAWLGSVVRRSVLDSQRRYVRRQRRELAVARPEGLAATSDVVARVEIDRAVVNAVAELPEPYRTTLLLRFYDSLPPREIARRMDVPVETVRARVRRGLERVRAGLDTRHGGDRDAWLAAIVPFLAGPPALGPSSPADTVDTVGTAGASSGTVVVTAAVVVGSLFAGFLGGLAWRSGVGAGGGGDERGPQLIAAESALRDERAGLSRLTSEITALRARRVAVETDLAETLAASAHASDVSGPSADSGAAERARFARPFRFPNYDAALASVDWDALGDHIARMVPLLDELYSARKLGDVLRPETVGGLQAHNGAVVAVVGPLEEEFPSCAVNAVITHPAFSATLAAAVCHARGLPLDAAQVTALDRAAKDASDAVDRVARGAEDAEFVLASILAECREKRAFAAAMRELLSPEQRALLGDDATRDVLGYDLFGPSQMFVAGVETGTFGADTDVSAVIVRGLAQELGLDAAQADRVQDAVRAWYDALPAAYLEQAPSGTGDLRSAHRLDRIVEAAEHMLDLMRRVRRTDLSPAQRAWLQRSTQVLLLRRRPE